MGSQNEMMIQTTELIEGAFTCHGGAKVKGGAEIKEPHSFLGNLQDAHPVCEETVQLDRVNEVHDIQTR